MSIWYGLGFFPMIIIIIIMFFWIHTKKGRTFYYNHKLDVSPFFYIWFLFEKEDPSCSNNSQWNDINDTFHEMVEEGDYVRASFLLLLSIVSFILMFAVTILATMILSILGPILYIPVVAMYLTLKKIKKSNPNKK